jgi:nucleoside-diphosphate-sugar epimerase
VKAAVTGCAGFIGSTLAERLLADGADVLGIDAFTDYYPRSVKERNLSGALKHPRFRFIEAPIQDVDLPVQLHDRTHVFHLAAQAGVRKSWGRDFAIYSVNNIEATQRLLEAAAGMRAERSSGRRAGRPRRSGADADARDALPEPVSPQACRSCRRAAVLPLFRQLRRADRVASLLHRLRPAPAARHGLPQVPPRHDRG